jgi:hypothetical protein
MLLFDIVSASRRVRESSARSEKVRFLADCLRRAEPDGIETLVALLSGEPRQGRIGLGPAALREAMPPAGAPIPELTVAEVDAALEAFQTSAGFSLSPKRPVISHALRVGGAGGGLMGSRLIPPCPDAVLWRFSVPQPDGATVG